MPKLEGCVEVRICGKNSTNKLIEIYHVSFKKIIGLIEIRLLKFFEELQYTQNSNYTYMYMYQYNIKHWTIHGVC